MRRALLLTATRPEPLRAVLDSWLQVRELEHWPLHIQIDPMGSDTDEVIELSREFPLARITVNPRAYGYVQSQRIGLERLFVQRRYDFVFGIRDDIEVAPDILEYLTWASNCYQYDPSVQEVQAVAAPSGSLSPEKMPGGWGTWRYWWTHGRTEGHLICHPPESRERPAFDTSEWPSPFKAALPAA